MEGSITTILNILKVILCTLPDTVHGRWVDIKFYSQARKNFMGDNDSSSSILSDAKASSEMIACL
jgi:hypothetical protein